MDCPTDVLSFSQQESELPEHPSALLGDIVISVPTARRQAAERELELTDELARLLAHGLLHLVGWDHDTPAKARRMYKETERLCNEIVSDRKGV